jgi:hypothetical protein
MLYSASPLPLDVDGTVPFLLNVNDQQFIRLACSIVATCALWSRLRYDDMARTWLEPNECRANHQRNLVSDAGDYSLTCVQSVYDRGNTPWTALERSAGFLNVCTLY